MDKDICIYCILRVLHHLIQSQILKDTVLLVYLQALGWVVASKALCFFIFPNCMMFQVAANLQWHIYIYIYNKHNDHGPRWTVEGFCSCSVIADMVVLEFRESTVWQEAEQGVVKFWEKKTCQTQVNPTATNLLFLLRVVPQNQGWISKTLDAW